MSGSIPIALFAYKRPDHTQKVLHALANCEGVSKHTLYIFADGPRTENDQKAVTETRALLRSFKACKTIIPHFHEHNKGLAKNITAGITEVLKNHEQVIVLEDDILLAPSALQYFEQALDLYRNDPRVMHISGYVWPVDDLPDTFLFRGISCWGWATWKRAWSHYESDVEKLIRGLQEKKAVNAFNLDGAQPYFDHLLANSQGRLNTWAIRWQASIFLKNGLSLMPGRSLVQNIGLDNSGEHSQIRHKKRFSHQILSSGINVKKIPIEEDQQAYSHIRSFFLKPENQGRKAALKSFFFKLFGRPHGQ